MHAKAVLLTGWFVWCFPLEITAQRVLRRLLRTAARRVVRERAAGA
jgi:hypothetical protein